MKEFNQGVGGGGGGTGKYTHKGKKTQSDEKRKNRKRLAKEGISEGTIPAKEIPRQRMGKEFTLEG